MRKIVEFMSSKKAVFTPVFIALSVIGYCFGGWYLLASAVVFAFLLYLFVQYVYPYANSIGDRDYWVVPKRLLDGLMPEFERVMYEMGYDKSDYRPQSNDCDDYALAGIVVLHELLGPNRPEGRADPMFLFSFRRDDGPRHRLFFVVTDEGRVYVDNWRINGSMYRKLSDKEASNGKILI
jgi:hypothetical protein